MPKKEMFKISCEYDIDQEGKIFESEADALKWAKETVEFLDCELEYMTFEKLTKDGLLSVETLEVM